MKKLPKYMSLIEIRKNNYITVGGITGQLVKRFKKCTLIFQEYNGTKGAFVVVPKKGIPYVGWKTDSLKHCKGLEWKI